MATKRKVKGTALSMPMGLALALAVSLVLTLVLAGLTACLALEGKIAESAIGYGAMGTVLVSSVVGALIAAARIKRRRLMTCLVSGGCYYLALLSITALFFGGQYQGMGVTALLVFAGAGSVALLGLKGERGGVKKSRKYRVR